MKGDLDDDAETAFSSDSKILALKKLKEMINRDDADVAAHFYVSLLYLGLGKFVLALKHARVVLVLSPDEPNIYLNIGCIHERCGDLDKAITFYKKELARNRKSTESLLNLGLIYFDRSSWRKTANCLVRYQKMGGAADVNNHLARAYNELGNINSEVRVYKVCLQRDPNDSWALQNLGAAMMDLGNKKKAIFYLNKAKCLDPSNWMTDRNLAKADKQ